MIDADQLRLLRRIPHTGPLRLLDRIVHVEPGRKIEAFRNVSRGDPMLIRREDGGWILPRVLVIEAIGQAALAMMVAVRGDDETPLPLFVSCSAEFDCDAVAPCRLALSAQLVKRAGEAAIVTGSASVGNVRVAQIRAAAAFARAPDLLGDGEGAT